MMHIQNSQSTQVPSHSHMHTHTHTHTHMHTHTHTDGYRLIVQDTLSPKAKSKKVIYEMQSGELSQGGERREERQQRKNL